MYMFRDHNNNFSQNKIEKKQKKIYLKINTKNSSRIQLGGGDKVSHYDRGNLILRAKLDYYCTQARVNSTTLQKKTLIVFKKIQE